MGKLETKPRNRKLVPQRLSGRGKKGDRLRVKFLGPFKNNSLSQGIASAQRRSVSGRQGGVQD